MNIPTLAIIIILTLPITMGLTGFDCGGPHLNITTVSLLKAGECDLDIKGTKSQSIQLQLLQLADFDFTPYIQCKVSVTRIIFHCGMHSHVSAVHNGHAQYIRDVPYQQCKRMHLDGVLSLGSSTIEGLRANTTSTHSITMAGSINSDGTCTGAGYTDPYGSWNSVIVQSTFKVTLRSGLAPVKINSGKITLRSGATCKLADSFCIDMEDGHTFWNNIPQTLCNFKQYDVLYEGRALKMENDENNNLPTIYTLTTKDITFALTKTTETKFCGYTLYHTEHPKLFIMEIAEGNTFAKKSSVAVENLDIFTYVNSKFVYVEKHVRAQMTSLYNDVMAQKCEIERQVITNALAGAQSQPAEFAYTIMKGPGYMGIPAGEAIHIVKCIPVEVKLRSAEFCYNELPVTFQNASYFLSPKSHILMKMGTGKECNRVLPVMYLVDDSWIRFLPKPIDAPQPLILKPKTRLSWTYLSPEKLAISGIYSQQEIESLREHIMFPAEKTAMINNVMRGMTGEHPLPDGLSIYNLLDEKTLEKIAHSTAKKIWNGFVTFGSASAGLLGIFIIVRLIKLLIDTLIHGYALHSIYGCGIHLIGAIWSSITHLLIHLARRREESPVPVEIIPSDKTPETEHLDPVIPPHDIEESSQSILTQPLPLRRIHFADTTI